MTAVLLDGIFLLLPAILLPVLYAGVKSRNGSDGTVFSSFAAGAFAVIPPAVFEFLFRTVIARTHGGAETLVRGFLITLLLVALPEETSRLLFFLPVKKRTARNYGGIPPGSGTAYGIALGLGFAFIENFLYFSTSPDTFLFRSLTSLPLHGACAILIVRASTAKTLRGIRFFATAVVLHAMYNTLIHLNSPATFFAPVLAIGALILTAALPGENGSREDARERRER